MGKVKADATDYECALRHKYRVVTGGPFVPGVTTICGVLDKPGLMWAAADIAAGTAIEHRRKIVSIVKAHREKLANNRARNDSAEKGRKLAAEGSDVDVYQHWCRGEFDRQWKAKAARGTRIHELAESWAHGRPGTALPEEAPYVKALEMFWKTYKPKFLDVECIVIHPMFEFGGRFDFIAELDGPNASGVFRSDWKTGGLWGFENAMQMIGYDMCKKAVFGSDGSLMVPTPQPDVDGSRMIQLRDDGTCGVYDPFETVTKEVATDAFLGALRLYKARQVAELALKEAEND